MSQNHNDDSFLETVVYKYILCHMYLLCLYFIVMIVKFCDW
jgi:hypothetical protein